MGRSKLENFSHPTVLDLKYSITLCYNYQPHISCFTTKREESNQNVIKKAPLKMQSRRGWSVDVLKK